MFIRSYKIKPENAPQSLIFSKKFLPQRGTPPLKYPPPPWAHGPRLLVYSPFDVVLTVYVVYGKVGSRRLFNFLHLCGNKFVIGFRDCIFIINPVNHIQQVFITWEEVKSATSSSTLLARYLGIFSSFRIFKAERFVPKTIVYCLHNLLCMSLIGNGRLI